MEEAQRCIRENSHNFLRVIRSDAELPEIPANDQRIYERARENLESLISEGLLIPDKTPGMYIYRVKEGGYIYTGLVVCVETEDYVENKIKRHEHTRYDKEEDRTRHIDVTEANTGLVVLLYRDNDIIFPYVTSLIPEDRPDAIVKTPQGEVHEIFEIKDADSLDRIESMFADLGELYIADGHHRAKSAVTVAERRRDAGTFSEEAGRFMAVLFADQRVRIHGYSRLVTDLGAYTEETFLNALSEVFDVHPYGEIDDTVFQIPPLREFSTPHHVIHMYICGNWYELVRPVEDASDPIGSLDVLILQQHVLEPMLGIRDPRGDPRLQYLGGARPLVDLQERVDRGEFALAFSMQPVRIETVLSIADGGGVMPPKSTWFEPKLLSGLVIHKIDE